MPSDQLIRFVLDPEGKVVPDLRHRLPGRGVWVTARGDVIAIAEKKRLFNRGFKEEVQVEPGLALRVQGLMEEGALSAISFALKAGEIVMGFAKVESALEKGGVIGIVQASEAAEDGRYKIEAAVKRRFGRRDAIPFVRIFKSEQLDLALGRSNVIHAALLEGRASKNVIERVAALARFLDEDGLVGIGDDGRAIEPPDMPETNAPVAGALPAGQKTE
jgi:predicted RNA-binding protein YlxR (DUF448 family)